MDNLTNLHYKPISETEFGTQAISMLTLGGNIKQRSAFLETYLPWFSHRLGVQYRLSERDPDCLPAAKGRGKRSTAVPRHDDVMSGGGAAHRQSLSGYERGWTYQSYTRTLQCYTQARRLH